MKVLILYAKVGNGHLKAAEAIKECLENKYDGVDIVFEDGLEYSSATTNKLVIKGYTNMARHLPELWGGMYNSSNNRSKGAINEIYTIVNRYLTIRLKKMIRELKPDCIVSTHPFVSRMLAYLKKKGKISCPIVSVVTDYAAHSMWVTDNEYLSKIVVATEYIKRDCMKIYGVSEDKMEVTGIPVSGRFKKEYTQEEIENIKKDFGVGKKPVFLLFAGGGLGLGQTTTVLKELFSFKDEIQLIAVCGRNEKQFNKFKKLVHKNKSDAIILGYTNRVPDLMQISTAVITKPGGLTSTECLCAKRPMVIINPIPGQEEENATFFVNMGTALRVSKGNTVSNAVSVILNNSLRYSQMQAMCEYLSRVDAAENIVKIIMTYKKSKK